MRLRSAVNTVVNLNSDEIRERLQRGEAEDRQLQGMEKRLMENLDMLTVAGNLEGDRDRVATEIAKVRAKKESLARVRAALLERQLDQQARMKATRFIQIVRDAVAAIDADEKASTELRHGIYGLRTLYQRFVRARQRAWERLTALDAQPDAATWRTWSQSPLLYLVADAVPLPEFRLETQQDVQRPRLLSLREWRAENGLRQAISDGSALKRVFQREPPENLKRIAEAVRVNPKVTQILKTTESHTRPHKATPKKPARKKQGRNVNGKATHKSQS